MRIFLLILWTIVIICAAPGVLFLAIMSTDSPRSSGLSAYVFMLVGLAIVIGGYWAILRVTSGGEKGTTNGVSTQATAVLLPEDTLPQATAPPSEPPLPAEPEPSLPKPIDDTKAKQFLFVLRLAAVGILLLLCNWVASDLVWGEAERMLVPLLPYVPETEFAAKSAAVFVIPIIAALALWFPNRYGYVMLQCIMLAEQCKTIILILLFVGKYFWLWLGNFGYAVTWLGLESAYFLGIRYVRQIWLTEAYKKIFRVAAEKQSLFRKKQLVAGLIYCMAYAVLWNGISEPQSVHQTVPVQTYTLKSFYAIYPLGSFEYMFDLSRDEKKFLAASHNNANSGTKIEIFALDTGELLQTMQYTQSGAVRFMPDGEAILMGSDKKDKTGSALNFKVRSLTTGKADEKFNNSQGLLESKFKSVYTFTNFSPTGKYFTCRGPKVEIWDSETGKLLAVLNGGFDLEALEWLTDRSYLRVCASSPDKQAESVSLDEILADGTVQRTPKDLILRDLQENIKGTIDNTISVRRTEDASGAVISGGCLGSFEKTKGFATVWDVEKEEKIFDFHTNAWVLGAMLHPDGKMLITFEGIGKRNGPLRIAFWDLATKKVVKALRTPPIYWTTNIRLIDGGKKAVLLANQVNIISLE